MIYFSKLLPLVLLPLILASGCKVRVVVPEGGMVTLGTGGACEGGQVCDIDVSDLTFDEQFTAVPDEGHVFIHWKQRPQGFFGGSTEPMVRLFTSGFADSDVLLSLLSSEEVFFLEPLFEREGAFVQVSGRARYEAPPAQPSCRGLNFDAIELRPIRGATVQIISKDGGKVLASTQTDKSGAYSVRVESRKAVFVRVRAELKRSGVPAWNVEVRNNTRRTELPLERRPIYWLDSPAFNTGGTDSRKILTAATGWTGLSYTEPRSASPFSVLDTIYQSMQALLGVDRSLQFPPLIAFWSKKNSTANGDIDRGEIGGAFYANSQLFLSGKEGDDDDSFDVGVIAHEWMHYAIDNLGRDDSAGGGHGEGDLLDMRVAFSEGAATALAAIALRQPQYCDTFWFNNRLSGGGSNAEDGSSGRSPGWFSETSVTKLIYDLWDTRSDGADTQSIGFAPIYDVIFNKLPDAPSFVSLFSFAELLKQQPGVDATYVNTLFADENVRVAGVNQWGNRIPHPIGDGSSLDVLPLFISIRLGETRRVCVNSQYDRFGDGNKLSEFRYLRFRLDSPAAVTVRASAVAPIPTGGANPELQVFSKGELVGFGYSSRVNKEMATSKTLPPGRHIIDITEWQFYDSGEDGQSPSQGNFPERVCFDVSLSD